MTAAYSQAITPNPDIPCTPGWCLMYVRQTFDLPAHYNTATDAWDNSTSQHRDYDMPDGVFHAVWFSLEAIPAGHVALRAPDGTVYSSSDNIDRPHHHASLQDLMDYYAYYHLPLTFLGWTEDVAGTPVITADGIAAEGTITQAPTDAPAAAPVAVPTGGDEDMVVLGRTKDDATVWAGNGITRRPIASMDVVESYQWLAANGWINVFKGGEVQVFGGPAGLDALGAPVPA